MPTWTKDRETLCQLVLEIGWDLSVTYVSCLDDLRQTWTRASAEDWSFVVGHRQRSSLDRAVDVMLL